MTPPGAGFFVFIRAAIKRFKFFAALHQWRESVVSLARQS
jgi:hypothetical protein